MNALHMLEVNACENRNFFFDPFMNMLNGRWVGSRRCFLQSRALSCMIFNKLLDIFLWIPITAVSRSYWMVFCICMNLGEN